MARINLHNLNTFVVNHGARVTGYCGKVDTLATATAWHLQSFGRMPGQGSQHLMACTPRSYHLTSDGSDAGGKRTGRFERMPGFGSRLFATMRPEKSLGARGELRALVGVA